MPGEVLENKQETPELLSSVEERAKQLTNVQINQVGDAFDKQQELQEKATYEKNKTELIKNIIGRSLNQEYNRTSPDNTKYLNKLFLEENTMQVKAYVAYYNTQITKNNALNGTDFPIININNFMKNYEAEKPQTIDNIDKSVAPGSVLETKVLNQEVGEFIDLTPAQQQNIIAGIGKILTTGQKINKLTLHGYADATQVTEMGAEKVQQKFLTLRQTLIDKGISASKLPSADYFKGVENMEEIQKQKILNEGRATARAMMQIAFLPSEHIKYINENTTNLTTDIDAKPVGGLEKGNKYTGGNIEMQATGNEKIKRELTEVKNSLLNMIDIRQINYVYTDSDGSHYLVGGINLSNSSGKLDIMNINIKDDLARSIWNRPSYNPRTEKDQLTFFNHDNPRLNTLYISINDPHKKDQDGKDLPAVKSLSDLDNRIIDNIGMNLVDENDKFGSFINSLNEFKDQSKGDKNKVSYVDNMISILQTYKEVDQELTKNQEIHNIIL